VTAPNYENATARVDVVAGQTVNVLITMTPRAPAAKITGHVVDETGQAVVATVKLAARRSPKPRLTKRATYRSACNPVSTCFAWRPSST